MTLPLPGTTPAFVDGMGVLLALARAGLGPGVNVFEDIPDQLNDYLPALVISRTGGASDAPVFHTQFWVHMQVWADDPVDPHKAAYDLSQEVARVFYWAKRNQTVALDADDNPIGWIAKWRESSGFRKLTDPDLPHVGRYVAVYDLIIRNPRPA